MVTMIIDGWWYVLGSFVGGGIGIAACLAWEVWCGR